MQQIVTHCSKAIAFTAYDVKWVPSSARLISAGGTARGTGTIKVWEFNKTELKLLSEIDSPASFKCSTFGASTEEERHLATGAFDGTIKFWDLEKGASTTSHEGHSEIVNAIDGCGGIRGVGAPELASGSRDGTVKVWDNRRPAHVASFGTEDTKSRPDCWAVAFGNAHDSATREVVAGFSTGDLTMFDLRTMKVRWATKLPNGVSYHSPICSIQFDRKDIEMNKMIVTTLDGKFYVFDLRTFHPTKGYSYLTEKAHDSTVWCAQHSPMNRDVFITTGGNGAINLYKYSYPAQRSKKDDKGVPYGVAGTVASITSAQIADQPVISYDWHPSKEGLACGAVLDQTIKVFVVPKLHLL